jgi:SAM-dependent methyltransferase
VLQCLGEAGVAAEGVEISTLAIGKAAAAVRPRIHQGDLLRLELPGSYELVYGLDVFEHFNPNRLPRYLERVRALVAPGGYLFANIPAFGQDPVFGTVFPLYLRAWQEQAGRGALLRSLHADEDGYPLHGHLAWAESSWWTRQLERLPLEREVEIERALHAVYDAYLDRHSPARKAFYVFSRDAKPERSRAIAERVRRAPSRVLEAV